MEFSFDKQTMEFVFEKLWNYFLKVMFILDGRKIHMGNRTYLKWLKYRKPKEYMKVDFNYKSLKDFKLTKTAINHKNKFSFIQRFIQRFKKECIKGFKNDLKGCINGFKKRCSKELKNNSEVDNKINVGAYKR